MKVCLTKNIIFIDTHCAWIFCSFVTSKKNFTCQTIIFFLNEVYIPLQKYASQHQAASIIFQVCKALLKDATHYVFKIVLSWCFCKICRSIALSRSFVLAPKFYTWSKVPTWSTRWKGISYVIRVSTNMRNFKRSHKCVWKRSHMRI